MLRRSHTVARDLAGPQLSKFGKATIYSCACSALIRVNRRRQAQFSMSAPATFILRLRHNIWHVTLNGHFFGDYRTEDFAMDGIAEAQRTLAAPAKIIREEGEGPL